MDIARAIDELYLFASEPRAFGFDELSGLVDPVIEPKPLRKVLISKSRFIYIQGESINDHQFILDSSLFQWVIRLNFRLAQLKKFSLTEDQLTSMINNLRRHGRWNSIPIEIVRWAQSLGLICKAYTKGRFVFPLARILSFMKTRNLDISKRLLADFCENRIWEQSLNKCAKESLKKGFSKYKAEISYIVKNREGLRARKRSTLQELGDCFNLTRERIRQLENRFWNLIHLHDNYRELFLSAFLYDFMHNKGSLILDINSRKANLKRFLAKCVAIPQIELRKIGLIAVAVLPKDIDLLKLSYSSVENISPSFISTLLESKKDFFLPRSDVQKLAKRISLYRISKLNRVQRTYLALRALGKPAHYSEITEKYNSLWPEHEMSERNIHGVLNRQEYGIVWIGIKGTYALKEWGYERPSKSLFETVTEIVRRKFEETGVPVPAPVIISEMGKYRKIVHPTSMVIAIHSNPRLKKVSNDTFIPLEPNDHVQEEISINDLDKRLKEFEQHIKDKK